MARATAPPASSPGDITRGIDNAMQALHWVLAQEGLTIEQEVGAKTALGSLQRINPTQEAS